jgi:hypothetical protein
MRWFLLCGFLMASWGVMAEEPFPYECKVMPVSSGTLMLPANAPALVMLHNQSDSELWITHPISDPSASAGWSSRLQSNRWSAFALGSQAFELSCIESKPGHEQQIPCSGVITVCQWLGIKTTDKQPVPYWAGENMPLSELLAHLSQRGFQLPEPLNDKR